MIKRVILLVLLIIFLVLLVAKYIPENIHIGSGDFRPYWSASYLLAHGQDFSNPGLMDNIERTLTDWDKPFTMMAWFAPTGMVVLLPFTLVTFEKAAFLWLLTNILVVSATAFLLWKDVKRKIWIPLLAVFTFPMTLLSLYVGQINTLVLFGLAIFISLNKPEHQYLRGFGLALTTIKPHLVILTLPLIMLDCIYKKQWKYLIGFFGTLFVSVIILTAFYPAWPISFWKLISSGMSTSRETPTISGLIAYTTGLTWGKWLWIPGLGLFLIIWYLIKEGMDIKKFVYLSIPLSLLVSPIGWGYDQIILLVPLLIILIQIIIYKTSKNSHNFLLYFGVFIYLIIFIMRMQSPNEVWFVWVPMIIFLILLYKDDHLISKKDSSHPVPPIKIHQKNDL